MKLSIAISVIRDALCVNIIMIMITIIILILIICGMPCVWMWIPWSQCRLRGPQATVSLTRHLTPLSPNVAQCDPNVAHIWDPNCWQVTHIRLRFWDHSGWRRVWVQAVARACADAIYLGQFVQSKYIIVINTRLSLFVKQTFWEDPKYGKSNFSFNVLYGRLQQTSLNGQDIPWRCSLAVWSKKNVTYRAFVGNKYFRLRS